MFAVVFACFSLILVADQSELGRVGAGFEQGGGLTVVLSVARSYTTDTLLRLSK